MQNKTFRLFISSTFNDFLEEREILNKDIYNEMDEFCRSRGYFFQLIDLRWGINNESAINQNTMQICLDEVKRCKQLSPKPNFLIMIGERYGWIPLPAKIATEDFEKIINTCSAGETAFLREWYVYDTNEIGGVYYLKTRTDEYIYDSVWGKAEKKLSEDLLACAKKCNFPEEKIKEITSSATEKEIFEGMLNNETCDNCIAFFRSDYPHKDEDAQAIESLRNRIRARMHKEEQDENIIELRYSQEKEYKESFKEHILESIKNNIEAEIERLEAEKKTVNEQDFLGKSCDEFFCQREAEFKKLTDYVEGNEAVPLFLTGESGSGKTTLLKELLKKEKQKGKHVFYGFYGLDDESYTLVDVLRSICKKIETELEITDGSELNENNISEAFCHTMKSIPGLTDAIIVVDGLDMYLDIESINECVFPSVLPSGVRLVISAADTAIVDKFVNESFITVSIEKFSKEESMYTLNHLLKQHNRVISNKKQQEVIASAIGEGTTPIHVKLIFEICRLWHSCDCDVVLGATPESTANQFIQSMYLKFGHDEKVVLSSMALISAAPYGLTEDELMRLLFDFSEVKEHFDREDRYESAFERMPFVIWSRLFYDLSGCLMLTKSQQTIVVTFSHNIFKKVFVDNNRELCDEAVNKMIAFFSRQNTFEKEYPNGRKALLLPALLRKNNDALKLGKLYEDLDFVCACVLDGRINETLFNLQYVNQKRFLSDAVDNVKLYRIFSCIQKNRETLKYYRNNFPGFAADEGILGADTVNVLAVLSANGTEEKFYPFPYAAEARISWLREENVWDECRYAVYNNSYVHICSFPSCTELCRIYVESNKTWSSEEIVEQVVWINENAVAVKTEGKRLIVYSLEDASPDIIASYDCDCSCVKYDNYNENLLFLHKKQFYAVNPFTQEQGFSLNLKCRRAFTLESFDLIEEENKIAFRYDNKCIIQVDATTGDLYDAAVTAELSWDGRLFSHVMSLGEDHWLIYSDNSFAIYDALYGEGVFLQLPVVNETTQFLVGRQYLVFYDDRIIFVVDFATQEIIYYKLEGALNVEWMLQDERLSVVTTEGLRIISLSDFRSFETPVACLVSRRDRLRIKNLKEEAAVALIYVKEIADYLEGGLGYKKYDYDAVFSPLGHLDALTRKFAKKASLVKYAADGKKVVVYEGANAMTIRDEDDNLILQVDKLGLSLVDGILGLEFSPDCNLLAVWRHLSVSVFDLLKGKCVAKISLAFTPAIAVGFKDNSTLALELADRNVYEYNIPKKKYIGSKPPKKLVAKRQSKEHMGAYKYNKYEGKAEPVSVLRRFSYLDPLHTWLTQKRVYCSDALPYSLLYEDGKFRFSDKTEKIKHTFLDFEGVLDAERIKDFVPLRCFLREKNDVFSEMYSYNDGRHIVLVCRMLNSVIVFDRHNNEAIAAYKHPASIIGNRLIEDDVMEIISNRKPYRTRLKINLPK